MLNPLATDRSVPLELLGLLPPAPAAGWPAEFAQAAVADIEAQRAKLQTSLNGPAEAHADARFTPADGEHYPTLRRCTRFSYAIWAVISPADESHQPVLEAVGTCERLRMAQLRMRTLSGQLE